MKIFKILLVSLSLISCDTTKTKELPLTVSTDNINFSNEKFQLSITKPESWYAQNVKELIAMQQLGSDIISGDDENFKAITEAALKTSLPLFGFHEFKPGTPTSTNSSLMGIAENISVLPGIKKGCDYLYHAKKAMDQSQIKMDYEEDCHIKVINGVDISYFNSQLEVGDNIVNQRYMACISGDYAIAIVSTIVNKVDTLELDSILSTLKVQCKE
ncbi:hypothetical protein [Thalassomonas sp. M1454]|uniref:hypothetical protein n=1 Tax=Thalassomonas sp. M1454 TaxID=2594477 RepID=UPI00117FBC63|nr:hypothetical protein [Thalassomonas sp. M1454]TRX56839.1 hypothetical protein FNN08_04785 [Thalassomonas sp. M1454]